MGEKAVNKGVFEASEVEVSLKIEVKGRKTNGPKQGFEDPQKSETKAHHNITRTNQYGAKAYQ